LGSLGKKLGLNVNGTLKGKGKGKAEDDGLNFGKSEGLGEGSDEEDGEESRASLGKRKKRSTVDFLAGKKKHRNITPGPALQPPPAPEVELEPEAQPQPVPSVNSDTPGDTPIVSGETEGAEDGGDQAENEGHAAPGPAEEEEGEENVVPSQSQASLGSQLVGDGKLSKTQRKRLKKKQKIQAEKARKEAERR